MIIKDRKIKRNIKDTVFTLLFKAKDSCLRLCEALNILWEEIREEDIKIITIKPVLLNGIYNDMALLIKDKLVLLVEVQSTWSENIVFRIFCYLAKTYTDYVIENGINVYSSKKIYLPKPELYVIYTGKKNVEKDVLSLNEIYFDCESSVDVKVKVITKHNIKRIMEEENIISEYFTFTDIYAEKTKEKGRNKEVLEEIINECIKNNVLREFMIKHKKEVIDIMDVLFDNDVIMESYEREIREDAMAEGMQQGMQQGMIEVVVRMFNDKKISAKEAADYLGVSVKKFLELAS